MLRRLQVRRGRVGGAVAVEGVERLTARPDHELADAAAGVGVAGRIHRREARVDVVVAVEDEVCAVGVEELPPRVGAGALGAVLRPLRGGLRRAERRLVPVRERARRMVLLQVAGQPLRLAREPGAGRAAAARLEGALDVERDQVPIAEVVGVPAVAGRAEVAGLALRPRHRLRERAGAAGGRAGETNGASVRVQLRAVVVVEVAIAVIAALTVVRIELVIARRRALQKLEGSVGVVEGAEEVLVEAVLVLLVAEKRDEQY